MAALAGFANLSKLGLDRIDVTGCRDFRQFVCGHVKGVGRYRHFFFFLEEFRLEPALFPAHALVRTFTVQCAQSGIGNRRNRIGGRSDSVLVKGFGMINDLAFDFPDIPRRKRIGRLPESYLFFNRTGYRRCG